MSLIADGLLIAGALAAAFYCWILSSRVKSLKDLDSGLGAAIYGLSQKVDEMHAALEATRTATEPKPPSMAKVATKSAKMARDLETMLQEAETPKPPEKARSKARKAPEERSEPVISSQPAAEPEADALTAAQRLQQEIRDKLSDKSGEEPGSDIVKTLQSLLAANK